MFTNAVLPKDVKTASRPPDPSRFYSSHFCRHGHFIQRAAVVFAFELFFQLFFLDFSSWRCTLCCLKTVLSNFHLWCCFFAGKFHGSDVSSLVVWFWLTTIFPPFPFRLPTIDLNSVKHRFHTWLMPTSQTNCVFLEFSTNFPQIFLSGFFLCTTGESASIRQEFRVQP